MLVMTVDPETYFSRVLGELRLSCEADARAAVMDSGQGEEDTFIAIDMESLSLASHIVEQSTAPASTVQTYKSFSRKGSSRGGERKAVSEGGAATSLGTGVGDTCAESTIPVSLASDQGTSGTATPITGRCKKLAKRPSPWHDPRRVVVMFATLSSMGTLILLYLTLSMVGGETNAQ